MLITHKMFALLLLKCQNRNPHIKVRTYISRCELVSSIKYKFMKDVKN